MIRSQHERSECVHDDINPQQLNNSRQVGRFRSGRHHNDEGRQR